MTKTMAAIFMGAALALTLAGTAGAQGEIRPGVVLAASEGITAHGHAEIKASPDMATLSVGVTTQGQNPTETGQDNATRTTAVVAALRKAGIAAKDIETQNYSVQPQYDYSGKSPVLTGYQVVNSVQVTVRDLTQVGPIIDKVTSAGANQVNGPTYDLSERTALESQALAKAAANAHQKAAAMAGAAGVGLGPLLTLTDGAAPAAEPMFQPMMARGMVGGGAATPIETQQITITGDVTAVYQVGAAQ